MQIWAIAKTFRVALSGVVVPAPPSGWALVDDEYDEMIANRICVGKKVLYILDRGWDERESHATWLRWFFAFGI
jgi:hypothetical protein